MERKVLLICAGGMSTGILMRKMEKYAEEQGISLKIEAVGMSAYEDVYKNYDVILLGPQVSYKKGRSVIKYETCWVHLCLAAPKLP